MKPKSRWTARAASLALCVLVPGAAAAATPAQGYPNKPIRFIVAFPAGSATDVQARIIGQKLTETWGQQVVVDNRPGANGIIATEIAAKSAKDGYTILFVPNSHTINPGLYRKLPYDTVKDFAPVTLVAHAPLILVVHPSLPARSVKELMALARSKPGQLNYASSGVGNITHFAAELFKLTAGVNLVHVSFTGGPPALTAIVSGQVQLSFAGLPPALPFVQAGKLRALAVTGAKRVAIAQDVPTVAEAGLPGYEAISWWGVLAPAGTSNATVRKLNAEIANIMQMQDVRQRFASLGLEPATNAPKQFAEYIKEDIAKWTKIVKDTGMRLD